VIEQRIPDQATGSDSGIENLGDLLAVPRLPLFINEPRRPCSLPSAMLPAAEGRL
jgi:hypothetical protein